MRMCNILKLTPFTIFSFQDNTYVELKLLCAWLYDKPLFFR